MMTKSDLGILVLFMGIVLLVGGAYWLVVAEMTPAIASVPVPYVVMGFGLLSVIEGLVLHFSYDRKADSL